MKKILFILYISQLHLFSQNTIPKDTVYLDENQLEISKEKFTSKKNNAVLYARSYETEKIIIYKLLYKYHFGKITAKESKQIKLLLQKNKLNDAQNNTILIKYTDTLYDYNSLYLKHLLHLKQHDYIANGKNSIKVKHHSFTKKKYSMKLKRYASMQKKCKKKLLKYNTNAFYVYNFDKGYEFNKNLTWIKDRILKNMFFKNMSESDLIIIKPNGDYFLKSGHFSDKNLKQLLKKDDWTSYINDWKNSLDKYQKNGIGIIRKFNVKVTPLHKQHCY